MLRRSAARFYALLLAAVLLWTIVQPGRSGLAQTNEGKELDPQSFMLYSSAPDAPDSELQAIVEEVVGGLPGTWGVAVKKLDTGQFAVFNGDKQQVSASLYKVWVLGELFRQAKAGILDLDDFEVATAQDAAYDTALGEVRVPAGSEIQLSRAAYLMVTLSDNTSAVLLTRLLGPANVRRFMQQAGQSDSVFDFDGGGDNLTTPLDALRIMEMIATSRLVDAQSSAGMVELMLGQQIANLLPEGLPEGTPFAHKTGALEYLLHDSGIIYGPSGPFIISAMSSELPDYGIAWEAMPELSRRVYEYFNKRPSSPAQYFPQTRQTVGHDFLKFWNEYGGVESFGLPIGPQEREAGVLTQQFERARLELDTGKDGEPGEQPQVVLGAVGQEAAQRANLSWPKSVDAGEGRYFEETGQSITGGFLEYWLNRGGELVFGPPISPAVPMKSPADGKTYLTQWFQRARMEYHPEAAEGKQIVLAALGNELAP